MILQAINQTTNTLSYPAESITITSLATVTIPASVLNAFAGDPLVISDITLGNLFLTDGTNTYSGNSALQLLFDYSQASTDRVLLAQNVTTLNQTVIINTANMGSVMVQVTGTFVATLSFEATIDGTNYFGWYGTSNQTVVPVQSITSPDQVIFNASGIQAFRVNCTAYTSGTAIVSIVTGQSFGGQVTSFTSTNGNFPVDIISASSSIPVTQSNPNSIGNAWPVKITDGTHTVAVSAGGSLTAIIDTSSLVAIKLNDGSGSSIVKGQTNMAGSLPVVLASDQSSHPIKLQDGSGTAVNLGQAGMVGSLPVVIASNQTAVPASQSGSWSITANAGTNLNTSALALDTSVNGLLLGQNSTTTNQTGPMVQGATTTNAPTYSTAKTNPLSLDTSGLLRVSLKDTPANTNKFLVTADAITFASAQHVINDASSAVIGHVIVDTAPSTAVTNAGTFAVQATVAAGATNIAKAEDVASADADVGVPAMAIRKATPANTSSTDGDYEMLQMSAGRLWASATIDTALPAGTNVIGKVSIDQTTPGTTNLVALAANQSVNNAQINGVTPLMGNGTTGTGSQRVTIASDNTAFSVNATLSAETTKVIGTVNQGTSPWVANVSQFGGTNISTGTGAGGSGIPRVTVSNDSNIIVTPPTLTKGTQGSTGFSTQDLKDAGRTQVNYYATNVAAGLTTVETAITLTKSSGTAATSTGTSFVITSGKKYRITNIIFATRGNAVATIQSTIFNFRINTGGAVTTSSTPILMSVRSASPATASAYDRYILEIPDGFEITGDGTLQFGVTAVATYVTTGPTWDVSIMGYEY